MTKRGIKIADYLKNEGLIFSQTLHSEINRNTLTLTDRSYLSVIFAISLTWTKHAQNEDDFINYASNFIDKKIPEDTNQIENFVGRFGTSSLSTALKSYQLILDRVKRQNTPNLQNCNLNELVKFQNKLLSLVTTLVQNNRINGIGPWLFVGPFKRIMNDQTRFWQEANINNLILPTGYEVEKGIKRLIKEKYKFVYTKVVQNTNNQNMIS